MPHLPAVPTKHSNIPFDPENLPPDHFALRERFGEVLFAKRLEKQSKHESEQVFQGKKLFNPDKIPQFYPIIEGIFRLLGLYNRGHRNFLNVQVVENEVCFKTLPPAFDGYRVLHLSDLHLDLDSDLTPRIIEKLECLDYDLVLITGDYRDDTKGCTQKALENMKRICAVLNKPTYGVTGNHDPIEIILPLEQMGLKMLINETVSIEKGAESITIAGIDDPHYYETHDFEKLSRLVSKDTFTILLSHAPETHKQASELDIDFTLAGHTHGGQICLPGNIVIFHNGDCPSYMNTGNWTYKSIKGYTSRGTGGCQLPLRFNCPGEITVHTLRRSSV